LQHTSAEFLKAEFDDIEWNHEAYQILIDWLKDSLLSSWKLDRSDFSTTIFLQIIWKIKWIYKWKPDWSWWENTERLLNQVFTKEELKGLEISWEWLSKTWNKLKINNEQQDNIELSNKQVDELIKKWKIELQKINKQNEKIKSKILQLDLILDISWMYKEYLQSILSNIKLKFLSNKDERYEKQINCTKLVRCVVNFHKIHYV
jgi:hypothetical protein